MPATTITLEIPDSILQALNQNQDEFTRELMLDRALDLFKAHKLTLKQAADLADLALEKFIAATAYFGIDIIDYPSEELSAELKRFQQ